MNQSQNKICWPVFGNAKTSKRKFWQRPQHIQGPFLIQGYLVRIGSNNATPKQYFFSLSQSYVLHKSILRMDLISKGSLNLKQIEIVAKLENFQGVETILFKINEKSTYRLFSTQKDSNEMSIWLKFLTPCCICNTFDSNYKLLEVLGKGSFASVYRVQKKDEVFAAKIYTKQKFYENKHTQRFSQMIQNEYSILKLVNHPNIMKFYEIYQEDDKIVLITEILEHGDLYQFLKQKHLTEKSAAIITRQIADALLHIHSHGYVHRDLKLENILFSDKNKLEVKIVDFGFSEIVNDQVLLSKAGTPGYIAPEIFRNSPFTLKGDMFSVGVILYCLVSRTSPFRGKDHDEIIASNKDARVKFDNEVWNNISAECKRLIHYLLDNYDKARYSAQDLLKDEWIIKNTEDIIGPLPSLKNSESVRLSPKRQEFDQTIDIANDESQFSLYQNEVKSLYRNSIFTTKSKRSLKSTDHKSKQSHRSGDESDEDKINSDSEICSTVVKYKMNVNRIKSSIHQGKKIKKKLK